MSKMDRLNAAMVIPTAIVLGMICFMVVQFSDSAFVGVAVFLMLPPMLPLLMGHLLFSRMHDPKARSLIALTHWGFFCLLGFVWILTIGPFAQSAGAYLFAFPFFVAPLLFVCWGIAGFLNRPGRKESHEDRGEGVEKAE